MYNVLYIHITFTTVQMQDMKLLLHSLKHFDISKAFGKKDDLQTKPKQTNF